MEDDVKPQCWTLKATALLPVSVKPWC